MGALSLLTGQVCGSPGAPSLHKTVECEVPFESSRYERYINALKEEPGLAKVAHGIMAARRNFEERVFFLEKKLGRAVDFHDLFDPYVVSTTEAKGTTWMAYEVAPEDFYISQEFYCKLILATAVWYRVSLPFLATSEAELRITNRFTTLFGFQIALEAAQMGLVFAQETLVKTFDAYAKYCESEKTIPYPQNPKVSTKSLPEGLIDTLNSEFARNPIVYGLASDVQKSIYLIRIYRWVRGIPPLPIPELPTSSKDDMFGYSHELPPIGLSAWLHLCRPCRKLCKPLTAYGVKVEDTVGFPLKCFVQPPYELPASVFAEEAAMMADTEGGGAAAAASSAGTATGSATAGSDALPTASSPAAAAAASCADLPDESDEARESDHLLVGTGPYVRHRAAAMAAAAAVEEELRTSSS